jgi:hypothetical protein
MSKVPFFWYKIEMSFVSSRESYLNVLRRRVFSECVLVILLSTCINPIEKMEPYTKTASEMSRTVASANKKIDPAV